MARLRGFPAPHMITPAVALPEGRPCKIEIGFGKGTSLLQAAKEEPGTFFVGVEAAKSCHALASQRAAAAGLGNVALIVGDGVKTLEMMPSGRLHKIAVLFPDPWPKRRHHKRRIVNPSFAQLVAERLHPMGVFVFKTDFASYFTTALAVLDAEAALRRALVTISTRRAGRLTPPSNFERKYRLEGRRIHAAVYVRADRPSGLGLSAA